MVPPSSDRISRVPPYLSHAQTRQLLFAYGAITRCGRSFQSRSAEPLGWSCRLLPVRSPLLGESRLISFPPATEMVQFAGFASSGLWIQPGIPLHTAFSRPRPACRSRGVLTGCARRKRSVKGWVSPFGHPGINASLPAPPGFSQARTSFFACDRQGIHRMHLLRLIL